MSVRIAILLGILVAIVLVPFGLIGFHTDALISDLLSEERGSFGVSGVVVTTLSADIFLPVPSSVVATASGYILGVGLGFVTSFTGLMIGCIAGFWFGRHFDTVARRLFLRKDDIEKIRTLRNRYGTAWLVVCRPIPVLAETSVFFAGISRMSFRKFMWVTAGSNLGVALLYSCAGALASVSGSVWLAIAASVAIPVAASAGLKLAGTLKTESEQAAI